MRASRIGAASPAPRPVRPQSGRGRGRRVPAARRIRCGAECLASPACRAFSIHRVPRDISCPPASSCLGGRGVPDILLHATLPRPVQRRAHPSTHLPCLLGPVCDQRPVDLVSDRLPANPVPRDAQAQDARLVARLLVRVLSPRHTCHDGFRRHWFLFAGPGLLSGVELFDPFHSGRRGAGVFLQFALHSLVLRGYCPLLLLGHSVACCNGEESAERRAEKWALVQTYQQPPDRSPAASDLVPFDKAAANPMPPHISVGRVAVELDAQGWTKRRPPRRR